MLPTETVLLSEDAEHELTRVDTTGARVEPPNGQVAIEGVPVADRVEFMGDSYRVAEKVGLMPLMRFAHAARKGASADDMEGLAAIYDMLHDCIHPDDWDRFETDATAKKAEGDDLLSVVTKTIDLLAARSKGS